MRRERPERYREIHEFIRFVTHGDYPWIRIRYPARLVLILRHVVDDVLLHLLLVFGTRRVNGTDQVHLIVLELDVVTIHVDHVIRIVYPEDGVRRVPMDRVEFSAARRRRRGQRGQD